MPATYRMITIASALVLAPPVFGDEVTDQLDAARRAYESGELRSAVDTLNFAISRIQEQVTARLLQLLPEPLPGWQADAAQSESGGFAAMITGTNLSRRYYRPDGAEVQLSLMADSPLLPMLTMFLSSPFMMQADPATKPYSLKGQRGLLKHDKESNAYELSLMLGNRILIQGKGSGLPDEKAVQQYLEALDLGAIQKAFGG